MSQLLMPVSNNYSKKTRGDISTITLDEIRSYGLKFPNNLPQTNVLYIQHPVYKNSFIPFENHELTLIQDKINEYAALVQALGAKELKVESDNASSSIVSTASEIAGQLGFRGLIKTITGTYTSKDDYLEAIEQKFKIHQKYQPKQAFKQPKNLPWLETETSWQQLVRQRQDGALLQHELTLETQNSVAYSREKYFALQVDFEALLNDVKAGGDYYKKEQFAKHSNAKIIVKVYFATDEEINTQKFTYTGLDGVLSVGGSIFKEVVPYIANSEDNAKMVEAGADVANNLINTIRIITTSQPTQQQEPAPKSINTSTSSNDKDGYIKEYLQMSKEEPISNRERKMLCEKYGISIEDAQRLEASCSQSKISSKEEEYLNFYKQTLKDGDPISNRERKSVCGQLGISVDRALQLEASCSNSQMPQNEMAYLKEYKELIKDGDLSNRERRQLAQKYNITEERALEIEKL